MLLCALDAALRRAIQMLSELGTPTRLQGEPRISECHMLLCVLVGGPRIIAGRGAASLPSGPGGSWENHLF